MSSASTGLHLKGFLLLDDSTKIVHSECVYFEVGIEVYLSFGVYVYF